MSDSPRLKPRPLDETPAGYAEWLVDLKARVRSTQFRAARAANAAVIDLYWSIGHDIVQRQETLGWGAGVIRRLSADLKREFPDQRGWSPSNLDYMRRFAKQRPSDSISQQRAGKSAAGMPQPARSAVSPQLAGKLPWGHIMALLDKTDSPDDLLWYAHQAVENGWSRAVLEFQVQSGLRRRLGAAPSNFADRLTSPDSDLAQQLTKDPYVFQHLGLVPDVVEHDLEQALLDRLQDTLLELGRGMALVGRQVRLTVDGVDWPVDLLLFHTEQLRYVVIELKAEPFQPAHLGQLSAYVMMVDGLVRHPALHAPTVGLLLCTGKRESTVRFALAGTAAPVAVAEWQGLPPDARSALPTVEELEIIVHEELAQRAALRAAADNSSAGGGESDGAS